MKLLIQNGQVIDPASQTNEVMDILVENGIISKIMFKLAMRSMMLLSMLEIRATSNLSMKLFLDNKKIRNQLSTKPWVANFYTYIILKQNKKINTFNKK